MKRNYILLCLIIVLVAGAALAVYLHGANIPVLQPAGPIALAERSVIIITLLLCSIVVVPVFVLLFYFAWKYRDDSPHAHIHHNPDWDHDSLAAEFIWWVVPAIIIGFLSVLAWQSSHELDPFNPIGSETPMTIQVVALDWKWLFIYPDLGIASVNMVEFPENVPVRFVLTADAPMNSFWIPSLGGQIMAMPGMTTQLNLMASKVGDFNGFSANISGDGFAGMAFTARAVSADDFQSWAQSIRQSSSSPLTLPAYTALASPSEYNPVTYYSPVDPSLYTDINMKFMMPGNQMMHSMGTNMPMSMPMGTSTH